MLCNIIHIILNYLNCKLLLYKKNVKLCKEICIHIFTKCLKMATVGTVIKVLV